VQPGAPSDLAAIGTAVEAEIHAGHVPGAVIVVGDRQGVLYRRAFGLRASGAAPVAMTTDTIFDLASLTKVVATTPAVMQLVEHGRLKLDAPVARYWPAFGRNGKAAITVAELLTHTSGLPPDFALRTAWSGMAAARERIIAERPVVAPGSRFLYSDLNFIVLGELVRRISGETLNVYAAQHIFRPLGMKHTAFRPPAAWRPDIAPTDVQDGALRWGVVQDPTAFRMGGVAGHAGLFSTADDLAIFARMLLNGGSLNGVRILSSATVHRMIAVRELPGGIERGLGWDIASPYSQEQDVAFGPGSYGHTGYSGTSMWLDPKRGAYVIILTSRLYPNDRGDAKPLREHVARIVADVLPAATTPVLTGIDVLEAEHFKPLIGRRVGLLTNQTGRDAAGRRTIDVLAHAPDIRLTAILSPEHGIDGDRDSAVASSVDAATGVPIESLYGTRLHPPEALFARFDALVVDLQDVGVRFYTYATTMAYAMQAAARAHVPVYVLDRPDPITATAVEGPVLDLRHRSFTGYFPMPVRHGMTLGELAQMFNAQNRIGAQLTVIAMRDYRRNLWYDQTGLPWVDPSPNLRSLAEATLYPGVALAEGANVSVGRGTATPFELLGAPWINGAALARYLQKRAIAGVRFAAVTFTPDSNRYADKLCHGIHITVTDRAELDTPRLGIELLAALRRLYPERFEIGRTLGLVGSRETLAAIERGVDPRLIPTEWASALADFKAMRAKYLLYR
jgi:uncharacterized protein YbbC (DUF1343 family)